MARAQGPLPGQMTFPRFAEDASIETPATRSKSWNAEDTPAIELVSAMRHLGGEPLDDFEKAIVLVLYAHCRYTAGAGLAQACARWSAVAHDYTDSDASGFPPDAARLAIEFDLAPDDVLALVAEYLDTYDPANADAPTLSGFIATFLEVDDPFAEPSVPAAATVAAPAGPKQRKLRDLTGKTIRYRNAKGWVVGKVTDGTGSKIAFTDEHGDPWSNVDRDFCKVIKETAPQTTVGAKAKAKKVVRVEVPQDIGDRMTKLMRKRRDSKRGGPGDTIACYVEKLATNDLVVEIVNGEPGEPGVYMDISLRSREKPDLRVYAHHPISDQVFGSYDLATDPPITVEIAPCEA